ncbi:MAG: hypothetical protein JNL34_05355 [Anaerolineae bacterium]|nr:hypothetical protein [Anaerolineae bacterium]
MARETNHKQVVRTIALGVLIALLLLSAAIVWQVLYPTYAYYGQVLSPGEFLELFNQGVQLHCVQIPPAAFDLIGVSASYACFHTMEEASAFSREVARGGQVRQATAA